MYRVSIELQNTSGSLGEREMLWEHEPQASISTAFFSSSKFLRSSKSSSQAFQKQQKAAVILLTRAHCYATQYLSQISII